MKNSIKTYSFNKIVLVLSLIFSFNTINAQDRIITKEGSNRDVKIIYVDKDYIYFYQPSTESQKTVRKISKKSISDYQYLSIEGGKNLQVIREDSLLFQDYLKSQGYQPISGNLNYSSMAKDSANIKSSVLNTNKTNTQDVNLRLTSVKEKGNSSLITSGVFILLGSAIQLYNINRKLDLTSASVDEINDFNKLSKNLSNITYGLYGGAGIFIIKAGINIRNGSVRLK